MPITVEDKIKLVVSYVFGWIGGLIIFFTQKGNRFLRFHAAQSTMLSLIPTALRFVVWVLKPISSFSGFWSFPFRLLSRLISGLSGMFFVVWIVLIIVCLVQAWKGDMFKLPIIGDQAEKLANKA